jgi:hypothetical protein
LLKFCFPYTCQKGIMKNMIKDQTNAIVIQVPSTRSSGCFHHISSAGGCIALTASPLFQWSFGNWNRDDFHDSPDGVKHSGHYHTDKQQQKRVIQYLLHHPNAIVFLLDDGYFVHILGPCWWRVAGKLPTITNKQWLVGRN